ncbi:MAG: hypothetical protein NTX86_04500 [Candidatus Dependentiae bacterium]|nr:hypothetical protein [Candidatus Dependentiae bacterium]
MKKQTTLLSLVLTCLAYQSVHAGCFSRPYRLYPLNSEENEADLKKALFINRAEQNIQRAALSLLSERGKNNKNDNNQESTEDLLIAHQIQDAYHRIEKLGNPQKHITRLLLKRKDLSQVIQGLTLNTPTQSEQVSKNLAKKLLPLQRQLVECNLQIYHYQKELLEISQQTLAQLPLHNDDSLIIKTTAMTSVSQQIHTESEKKLNYLKQIVYTIPSTKTEITTSCMSQPMTQLHKAGITIALASSTTPIQENKQKIEQTEHHASTIMLPRTTREIDDEIQEKFQILIQAPYKTDKNTLLERIAAASSIHQYALDKNEEGKTNDAIALLGKLYNKWHKVCSTMPSPTTKISKVGKESPKERAFEILQDMIEDLEQLKKKQTQ